MRWMKNNKVLVVLLVVIIASLAVLGFTYNTYRAGGNVPNILGNIFSKISGPVSQAGKAANEDVSGIFNSRDLIKENKKLKEKNEKLTEELQRNNLKSNELSELRNLAKALNYDFAKNSNGLITTNVTAYEGQGVFKEFTISAGSASGIKVGNVVICGEGLVGKVYSVGKHNSKILAITDGDNKVSFGVKGNKDILGITQGAKNNVINGYMMNRRSNIREGDEVVTTGMGLYPKDIVVGKVINVIKNSDRQFTEVQIKSKVNFGKLDKVSVII